MITGSRLVHAKLHHFDDAARALCQYDTLWNPNRFRERAYDSLSEDDDLQMIKTIHGQSLLVQQSERRSGAEFCTLESEVYQLSSLPETFNSSIIEHDLHRLCCVPLAEVWGSLLN